MTETLANGYSSESALRELSNEYQHDRVCMVFRIFCVLAHWAKVASALEGIIGTFSSLLNITFSFSLSLSFLWFLSCTSLLPCCIFRGQSSAKWSVFIYFSMVFVVLGSRFSRTIFHSLNLVFSW